MLASLPISFTIRFSENFAIIIIIIIIIIMLSYFPPYLEHVATLSRETYLTKLT